MPVSDSKQDDGFHEVSSRDPDSREKDKDRSGKGKPSAKSTSHLTTLSMPHTHSYLSPSTAKDLSHVPCKFFRVGSCTAGSSCPFSHAVLEPGQHKEVCTWFVKGNCKFGHKCALAHILPGQSMSMDRKNKKAAQAAANAANGGSGSGKDDKGRGARSGKNTQRSEQKDGSRSALLLGSTAPTRNLSSSRGSMPIMKSALAPSAPAPPVKDTDFASYGLPDESNKLSSPPAQGRPLNETAQDENSTVLVTDHDSEAAEAADGSPAPLPTSIPNRRNPTSPHTVDFGPIGSPPRASPGGITRVNGFSPGTSPHHLSPSPFSAPGTQTSFLIREQADASIDYKTKSGLSASLSAMSWASEFKSSKKNGLGISGSSLTNDIVVEDDDLEEFIPGSLSDLLTPEERSRRFSRTASANRPHLTPGQEPIGSGHQHSSSISGATTGDGQHHRYSRSVPAPSMLQDIRSIWTDNSNQIPSSPDTLGVVGTPLTGGGLGNGTPSSFSNRIDEMLAPTNASAAFLPGLQHHYLKSKTGGGLSTTSGISSPYLHTPSGSGAVTPSGAYSSGLNGMALSPPRVSGLQSQRPFEAAGSSETYLSSTRHLSNLSRGGGAAVGPESVDHLHHLNHDRRNALSPSALALQAHAPGQSLPQGLAAGYSRIHALPLPVIPSPSGSSVAAFSPGRSLVTSGGFSPGSKALGHSSALSGEWRSMSPGTNTLVEPPVISPPPPQQHYQQSSVNVSVNSASGTGVPPPVGPGLGGLETIFSRLSYSAAASRMCPFYFSVIRIETMRLI